MTYTAIVTRLKAPELATVIVDRLYYDAHGEPMTYQSGTFGAKRIVLDSITGVPLLARTLWSIAYEAGEVTTPEIPANYTPLCGGNTIFFLDNKADQFAISFSWGGAS